MTKPFSPPTSRLTIGSLDDSTLTVTAQYNPKELDLARTVPWKSHNGDNTPDARRPVQSNNDLEFTGGEGRTLSIELLFDGVEKNQSVLGPLLDLDEMATPKNATSTDPEQRRPHQCVVVWGEATEVTKPERRRGETTQRGIPPLRCVIESLSVKYTMFSREGLPLRAVANVKLKEASVKQPTKPDDNRAEALARISYAPKEPSSSR